MTADEYRHLVRLGENSAVQFKENLHNVQSLTAELVAFANSGGGKLLIGVNDKTAALTHLEFQDIHRLNQLLATAAQEQVKPPLAIRTETLDVDGVVQMVVSVPDGPGKPYRDKDGIIYLKIGADKRKVTSNDELARLLQQGGDYYAEEQLVPNADISEFDVWTFREFYEQKYHEKLFEEELPQILENLRLAKHSQINLAGILLFGKRPAKLIPQFYITTIRFAGNDITTQRYFSSEDVRGTLPVLYQKGLSFLTSSLLHRQGEKDFNSLGELEIPEIVLRELLVNALVHRDYFLNDSIKLYIFDNRVEIRSPGRLPNNLTEAQIVRGIRRTRNTIINSFAPDVLPYRGAGSGILRALQAYKDIHFVNDMVGDQFTAIIQRPAD